MYQSIGNRRSWRTIHRILTIPEVVGLHTRVEVGHNDLEGQKAPEDASYHQSDTQTRQFILPDDQDPKHRYSQRNIFFARGSQDASNEKPYVAFVGEPKYGIQQ